MRSAALVQLYFHGRTFECTSGRVRAFNLLSICRTDVVRFTVHENLRGTRPRGGRMLELGKKHNLSVTKPIPTRGAFFLYGDCLVVCLIRFRRIVGQGDGTKGSVIPFELGRWRDVYVLV